MTNLDDPLQTPESDALEPFEPGAKPWDKLHMMDPTKPFPWTAKSELGAMLIAESSKTNDKIAKEVGVSAFTIRNWKSHPDFRERVREIVAAFQEAVLQTGILLKEERISSLQDTWQRLRQVIEERASAPEMADVPGGQTGLMVRSMKQLGSGPNTQIIEEFTVDSGLLTEMRNILKHVAQEQGQWTEKTETSHQITKVEVVYEDKPIDKALPEDT
jgi:hypothetical protein